jgi:hypothetical protein
MNLSDVLDRATDGIEPPGLSGAALTAARARQARRRAAVGAATAVAAVVAIVGVSELAGGSADDRPAGPASPDTSAPAAGDPAVGPSWDPRTVVDAPVRASVLPSEVLPPDLPPNVGDDPMDAAVLAWPEAGADLKLLGADGRWRCIRGTSDLVSGSADGVVRPTLSDDGTQVAMAGNAGILVVDLPTGEGRTLPWPDALAPPWDTVPSLAWLPGGRFAVSTWPRTWIVGPDGAVPAPYGRRHQEIAVDPDGTIVENNYREDELRLWRDDALEGTARMSFWGERLAAGFGRVAFTGGGTTLPGDGGPLVVDTATGELLGYRPIRDPHATYSDNGHLTALGFLDADTVVYLVGPARHVDRRIVVDAWHLIAWDLESGELQRLATGSEGMQTIAVAVGALAGG